VSRHFTGSGFDPTAVPSGGVGGCRLRREPQAEQEQWQAHRRDRCGIHRQTHFRPQFLDAKILNVRSEDGARSAPRHPDELLLMRHTQRLKAACECRHDRRPVAPAPLPEGDSVNVLPFYSAIDVVLYERGRRESRGHHHGGAPNRIPDVISSGNFHK
jgi:hypothetical protein